MPAPHPTTSPAGTESGSLRPSASVGSCSRIATTLANPTAPANPSAATRSAMFSFAVVMTSKGSQRSGVGHSPPRTRARPGEAELPPYIDVCVRHKFQHGGIDHP